MSHDEVVRSEGVGGWGLVLVVAVVAAVFSMVTQPQHSSGSPTPAVAPSVTPSASAPASAPATSSAPVGSPVPVPPSDAPAISLDPTQAALAQTSGFVSVADICRVTTDHRTTLAITALLRNGSQVTERLAELSPALPLAGLVDNGTTLQSGTCKKPYSKAAKPRGQALPPGAAVLVTLHLQLPKTCPQALPVGLDVTVSIDGDVREERVALLPDLGQLTFTTCRTT